MPLTAVQGGETIQEPNLLKDKCSTVMRIYNSDGSEPEMCGNGIRCMAEYVFVADVDKSPDIGIISTLAGPIVPEILANGEIKVDMGDVHRSSAAPTRRRRR